MKDICVLSKKFKEFSEVTVANFVLLRQVLIKANILRNILLENDFQSKQRHLQRIPSDRAGEAE